MLEEVDVVKKSWKVLAQMGVVEVPAREHGIKK
jgi:hypothetical protein